MGEINEDWDIECSDEEFKDCKGPWEPNVEEIDRLYTMLQNGEMKELHWKCPGYRSPSPEFDDQQDQENDPKEPEEQSDFDFMDEVTSPKLKINRNKGEETLKGSAKKKTASLDGVLNNMRRHNLLPSKAK